MKVRYSPASAMTMNVPRHQTGASIALLANPAPLISSIGELTDLLTREASASKTPQPHGLPKKKFARASTVH
ncbi:hypothetical protein I546_4096 [Mycobacterium kansasii 732]|uniref:hypothetical protein n=1 Tax=Mycobacterium pseudokansasii TaxID=2341080 RepID=UPI00044A26C2|nr:hypothetical protein [Mycobacterium pseudokansasii]EUA09526.1 hypothetical protein I546_4096 [Mycobacterium kansasii 732]VAZ93451.1 hypothetical protein LAUMK35_02327 [Mycobacterium pseudokansasii]VAZ94493.1 hypothetical protein LAUMK21_02327 [Mycobacterium pseudokansasii]